MLQSAPTLADVPGAGDAEPAGPVLAPGTGGVPIGVAVVAGDVPQAATATTRTAAAALSAVRAALFLLPEGSGIINGTFPVPARADRTWLPGIPKNYPG